VFELRSILFRGDINTIRGNNVASKIVVVLVLSGEIGDGAGEIPGALMKELDKSKNSWSGGG